MKFLVDELPQTCKDCPFHAPAMMMTQLGVQKEINICTVRGTLIPPTEPNQEPPTVDIDKTPKENDCPCYSVTDQPTYSGASHILLAEN